MQVDTAQAAKQKAEEQVASLKQSHKAEMEAEKLHYEALLQKARSAQAWPLLLCKLLSWLLSSGLFLLYQVSSNSQASSSKGAQYT